ncbi:MAG TPA: tRNA (adenosine(37)-N6)-threonylcarbamoyltransferase complex transferase subunit TsaD [Tepidisphaeraceae bacterium]|nr:tRNA (adenosine(37)-N6)-threonylcarbamoyltransferase complex transferase subunit TsaD [Tepidisphaeraceae bacterium]
MGIESTCDETAAAVVRDGTEVLSNVVATQTELHAKYRGVVPEIASRAHIENILPVITESLEKSACGLAQLDAIAVAHRPGLIGSLLIGVTAAKTLAWSLNKPLIGVDHVHAHLYSVLLDQNGIGPTLPALGLVVSGGHTAMYDVQSWTDVSLIGSTIDDAAGEAYDKVAAILGLGYPGGPIIDQLAQTGEPRAIQFPRSMLGRESLDFSFSGLKTAVLYHVRGVPGRGDQPAPMTKQHLHDVAASFQAACIDTIIAKLRRGVARIGAKSIIVGGGVSANRGLRTALANFDLPVFFPKIQYCTDNAAMSAGLAYLLSEQGGTSSLDLDAITYSQFKI